jgi:hypothetical protein
VASARLSSLLGAAEEKKEKKRQPAVAGTSHITRGAAEGSYVVSGAGGAHVKRYREATAVTPVTFGAQL